MIVIVQVCRNPEILLVEYAHPVTLSTPGTTTSTPKVSQPSTSLPNEATNTEICLHIDSLQHKINTYTVLLKRPLDVKEQRKRCLRLTKKLSNHANKSNSFLSIIYPKHSCQSNGNDIKLLAKLNLKALKYVSVCVQHIRQSQFSYLTLNCITLYYSIVSTGVCIEWTADICHTIIYS